MLLRFYFLLFCIGWGVRSLEGQSETGPATKADTLLINGNLRPCDGSNHSAAKWMALGKGRILAIGSDDRYRSWQGPATQVIDLQGDFVSPGFCDSHLHFSGLGQSLETIDLRNAKNWEEIVDGIAAQAKNKAQGEWIVGRGWHQSKWNPAPHPNVEGYPVHEELSRRVPLHPVLLIHASGHACFANAAAMKLANITNATENPDGGEIVRDRDGNAIGIFRENAQRLIYAAQSQSKQTQEVDAAAWKRHMALASQECLKHGITSVHDAGIGFREADLMASLADTGGLKVRIFAMIREGSGSLLRNMPDHRWIGRGDGMLTIRSVKVSVDGALGPHGAWLLEPYDDLPTSAGLNTVAMEELEKIAGLCQRLDLQLCVHAIGDRANRETLNVFEKVLGSSDSGKRWRIEHAQHIHPNDLPRFRRLGVIPIMQANHCTSDAIFVMERLGQRRASENAYRWRALVDSGCIVPNGTDAPVELVDPRVSLYASVTRKLPNGERFFPDQCLSREEGLLSYTLWPAIAAFQETDLGSLTVGKYADLVRWDTDLLTCPEEKILTAKVKSTWLKGQLVYAADSK